MDKNASFYVAILLMAVVVATVTSFGGDDMGGFGGDYYDRKYQNWFDKRAGGLGQPFSGPGFGRPLGQENRYFNWKEYLDSAMAKRQLNYGPRSFGNFQRYFTNGLQDWRSTYTGIKKRAAPSEQAQAHDQRDAAAPAAPSAP